MVGRRVRVWHIQALYVLVNSGEPATPAHTISKLGHITLYLFGSSLRALPVTLLLLLRSFISRLHLDMLFLLSSCLAPPN